MITRRTKVQLLIFVVITLVGVSYVGARYAKLDRVFVDRSYTVVAHYPESGGIFVGGEVTYRGVSIGRVSDLELTDEGVDVHLEIENEWDRIPADTKALVGNRSAVGEQYVELQPNVEDGPYLEDGSEISEVETPIATEKLLGDIATTVASVDQQALRTTIHELGTAFQGTGEDLQQIIDTGNSFIQTADENFEVTAALIEDSNTVLTTQVRSATALRMFARELDSFSTALAGADKDLRKVIDNGSYAADQLRTFLEDNQVELADLLNNLVTTGEVVVRHLDKLEQMLVIYPYAVEGSFTVVSKSPGTGLYDAHFGMIITTQQPCYDGYQTTQKRSPSNGENLGLNTDARCTEPPTKSNARGAQNLPRVQPDLDGPDRDEPVVASYDPATGELTWGGRPELVPSGNVAPPSLGEDSWKWLYLQPLMDNQG